MNLDQLNSVAEIPTWSYAFWGGAILALVACGTLVVMNVSEYIGEALIALFVGMVLTSCGVSGYNAALDGVKDESFHIELEKSYGLTTDAGLPQITVAAQGNSPVLLKDGDEVIEVRPYINGTVLTFLKVEDGKPIQNIAG